MQKANSVSSGSSFFQRIRNSSQLLGELGFIAVLKRWLTPPQFVDPEENRRVRTLYTFLLITPIASNLIAITLLFNISDRLMVISIFMLLNLAVLVSLILIRHKRLLFGGGLLLITIWLLVSYTAFFIHGEIAILPWEHTY
ncbi:MAG: hypothetical protein WBG94_01825 [Anaerolineales bacterium]